jgi:thioesterase domain-containing protein/acyl carrier protein
MLPVKLWQTTSLASVRLLNAYGPTEATITSTIFEVNSLESFQEFPDNISIGRPISNTQVYILDQQLQPVPVGVFGELHIGGDGLARGYLNRRELTSEKFIPNPFSNEPNSRLYKTGDLARYLPDGNIKYIGRIDNQVKIRGFRIELGEIEATLAQHPEIKEAVVIAREDVPGDKRLVAYIVPETKAPTKSELRSFLKQKLPDYMLPSVFITLESLPLTPNGKIDRRALPAPDTTRDSEAKTFVAPRNSMELQLAQIWEGVLGIQPIGVTDNFFELGGHSLLAVRLVAEIEKALQKKLPLAALFQFTTIAELAELLLLEEVEESDSLDESLPPLEPEDFRALLTIVAGREGTRSRPDSLMVGIRTTGLKPPLFCCANAVSEISPLADYLGSEQPFYLLESGFEVFRGKNNKFKHKRTEANIRALAARHVRDLEAVHPEGPYLLAGYSFGRLAAYEVAKQLQERGKTVAMLAILDTPGSGLMYRYYLQKLQPSLMAMKKELLRGSLLSVARQSGSLLWELLENLTTQKSLVGAKKGEYLMQGYPGKITLFVATAPTLRYIKIRNLLFPAMGWSDEHSVELIKVPGDHWSMLTEPHVRVLADKFKTCIDKAMVAE